MLHYGLTSQSTLANGPTATVSGEKKVKVKSPNIAKLHFELFQMPNVDQVDK